MKLILNQPLHPVERNTSSHRGLPPPLPRPATQAAKPVPALPAPGLPAPRAVPRPTVNGSKVSQSNGKHTVAKAAQPRATVPGLSQTPASAGPSLLNKRPPSPTAIGEVPRKKVKESMAVPFCLVCGTAPLHVLSKCPAVLEGPQRCVPSRDCVCLGLTHIPQNRKGDTEAAQGSTESSDC